MWEGRQAALLGVRVGLMFLIATGILVFAAYFVLSHNFQTLLTDYTLKLVQSMVDQSVATVEYELRVSQEQVTALADSFSIPATPGEPVVFPTVYSQSEILHMAYVTENGTFSPDGRQRALLHRPDVAAAFSGESAVYGPYFNAERGYVICYSAPIRRDNQIAGVLSIEKDGYFFCSLIKEMRFVDTGEAYIINAEGTDIAVSDPSHIDWVKGQYNARHALEQADPSTRSILDLEQKGLDGASGVGTYYRNGGLCYLVYAPIPSTGWVLLAGLRQDEFSAMTQSTLYASLSKGPALCVCIALFFLLTTIIVFWIVSNLQKSAELNEKLSVIANYDALTGIKNRNSYHAALDAFSDRDGRPLACIYIDANGLHELNNHLGHQAGDKMLKSVADVFQSAFPQGDMYRIGGDEFVLLCKDTPRQAVDSGTGAAKEALSGMGYEVSVGIAWRGEGQDIQAMVHLAEEAMQRDKQRYYRENGKERQLRALDQELEQILLAKQDADTFLSVLAPEYKGVYFVNLGSDTIRHLYIPPYFGEILEEVGDVFSKALLLYAARIVRPEYRQQFQQFCNYKYLDNRLNHADYPEFLYQKKDGAWVKLQILKFKTYTLQNQETLWIFSNMDGPQAKADE